MRSKRWLTKTTALTVVVAATAVLAGCAQGEPAPTATSSPAATPSVSPTATAEPAPSPSQEASKEPTPSEVAQEHRYDIDSAASLQVVVNKHRPLNPASFEPPLTTVSITQDGGAQVQPPVNDALIAMDAASRAAIGEGVFVFSAYRSYSRQTQLYEGYVARYGQAAADTTSARPGHSEHQTGLTIDVVGTSGSCRLDRCYGQTASGQWIAQNAWQYGFIVRYPSELDAVTGYAYEPWHLRFVGVEVATAMHEAGVGTLEEFFGLPPAPDYA